MKFEKALVFSLASMSALLSASLIGAPSALANIEVFDEERRRLELEIDGKTATLDLAQEDYRVGEYDFNPFTVEYKAGDVNHLVIQGGKRSGDIEYMGQISDLYKHYADGDPLNLTYKGKFHALTDFLYSSYGDSEDKSGNNFGRIIFDSSLDLGRVGSGSDAGVWEGVRFYDANAESFENYTKFVSAHSAFDIYGYEGSKVDKFLNYGTIQVLNDDELMYIDQDVSLSSFQVSPSAEFISLNERDESVVNRSYSIKWGVGDPDEDSRFGLERIILAGKRSDRIRVGDADEMSVAILGWNDDNYSFNEANDFPNLKTWQVGADQEGPYDDSKVVWEFGGEGGYADVDAITIDVVRGTARLTSDNGFGDYFAEENLKGGEILSKVIVKKDGALDLYGNSVSIDDLVFKGGTLKNGKDDDEAFLDSGFVIDDEVSIQADGPLKVSGGIKGKGGLSKSGSEELILSGASTYEGSTTIEDGQLSVTGNLPNTTEVIVKKNAYYNVYSSDTVGSISGDGNIEIAELETLRAGELDSEFSGEIYGAGKFRKVGEGKTIFSGKNTYKGNTEIVNGDLTAGSLTAIPKESAVKIGGSGHLDLALLPKNITGDFEINDIQLVSANAELSVSTRNPLKVKDLDLDNGKINAYVFDKDDEAPIQIENGGEFDYDEGTLNVITDISGNEPEGTWSIIDGEISNEEKLAKNTVLIVNDVEYPFKGLGEANAVTGASAMYQGYLKEGSLNLVVEAKSEEQIDCQLHPASPGCPDPDPDPKPEPDPECMGDDCKVSNELPDTDDDGLPDVIDPEPEKPCEGDDCLVSNELPDTDGDGEPDVIDKDDDNDGIPDEKDPDDDGDGELDQLPGCEVGDDLCDVISDIPGDEDEAWEEEEEVAGEIIDALLDGVEDEEIDLAFSFDYGELARLVGSGLAPRNVDAAGRGLALHNNLLVDAVFERQPLRQFEELLIAEEVVEESVAVEEAVIEEAAPVQPLWLKADELSDGEAAEYVEGAVAGGEDAEVEVADAAVNGEAAVAIEVEEDAVVVEFDGVSLVDEEDDELDLAKRDGVSAWVKGFGGNSRADESSILYNDYSLDAYGTSFGVDVALSESFQIGAYANYGDLNVHQHSGETGGGSWNPEGWGGGLTAQYSTRHFYVQGLLGASEFSGEQSRNILQINNDLGGNTAKGDKSVTSYVGALRIGAPFKTGGVVLEPQGQVVWTRNHEQGFSESHGTEKNLRLKYKSRTTNFAETELGMKLSVPIRTGERALLVPSLRAAWLADWNQANEGQEIGYKFTNQTVDFESQLGTENGALIEAGLDYTVQNFNGVSVKLYGRGGMEFWASDRGTTWRASGGVTFQF